MIDINENYLLLDKETKTAEEAIREAGKLLVDNGNVEERYIDAMVKGFKDVGPYIVLAPNIAIPHARPEHGVLKQGLSFVRLKEPVVFGHPTNDPVQLVFAICGIDNTSHMSMLSTLAEVLRDQKKLNVLLSSNSKKEILSILQQEGVE